MALVEVDVIGAQPSERQVDLLQDLLAGKTAVAVDGEVQLGGEDERVPWAAGEDSAEKRFRAAARVDVRGVEEGDPDVECPRDARLGLLPSDSAAVGEPRSETDLGDL